MVPRGPYDGPDAVVDAKAVDEAVHEDVELGVMEVPDGGQGVCEVVQGENGGEEEPRDGGGSVFWRESGSLLCEAGDGAGLQLRRHVGEMA